MTFRAFVASCRSGRLASVAWLISASLLVQTVASGCMPSESPATTGATAEPTTMTVPQATTLATIAVPITTQPRIATVFPEPTASASPSAPRPTLLAGAPVSSDEGAIEAVQVLFPEVASIQPFLTPQPFQGDRVIIRRPADRWELIFVHGVGDCEAGCLSTYYWYFYVWPDGRVEKAGEFSRVFEPNSGYIESGTPLWGFPR